MVHNNLKYTELIMMIAEFSQNVKHKRSDMCIVAIMSHGDEKNIVTADGFYLDIQTQILEKFNTANCPNLERKPKWFIIQACR